MLWSELGEVEQRRLLESLTGNGGKESQAMADAECHAPLIRSFLDELKPKLRMAFILRELEGNSYGQVAEILGTSNGSARVQVMRARTELQKRFRRHLNSLGKRDTL
jgi:RNA polymerase sigma factor (sigma-70 family)